MHKNIKLFKNLIHHETSRNKLPQSSHTIYDFLNNWLSTRFKTFVVCNFFGFCLVRKSTAKREDLLLKFKLWTMQKANSILNLFTNFWLTDSIVIWWCRVSAAFYLKWEVTWVIWVFCLVWKNINKNLVWIFLKYIFFCLN